jgi:[acyl-carrier-protein] S-malonyltransferase
MNKVVLLFSGQGAQKVGMGKDLVEAYPSAKALFEKADSVLGPFIDRCHVQWPS